MIPKLIIIKKLDALLENNLVRHGFERVNKKREIEVQKKSNDVIWSYTYIYSNGFDLGKNEICGIIEPYVSIFNKEINLIFQRIMEYQIDERHIIFLMTVQISGIIQYPSGVTKGVYSPKSNIRIYDSGEDFLKRDNDIHWLAKETMEQFEKFALPFFARFNSLENMLPELGRETTYLSLYASGVPQRILAYLIVLKLLGRPDVKEIAEGYKEYFQNKDILSDHRKGYRNFCKEFLL